MSRLGCFLFLYLCSALVAQEGPFNQEWMLLRLKGTPIGYLHRTVTLSSTKKGARYLTVTEQSMTLKRMGTELTLRTVEHVIEEADGTVVSFQKCTSQQPPKVSSGLSTETAASADQATPVPDITTSGYREGEEMVVFAHGSQQRARVPRGAIGPWAVECKNRSLDYRVGLKGEFMAYVSEFPLKPVIMSWEVKAREPFALLHETRDCWRVATSIDTLIGIEMQSWIGEQGNTLAAAMPFGGFGDIEMVTCTEAEALAPRLGQEIMSSTLISPDRPLVDLKQLHQATYRLSGLGRFKPINSPEQEIVREEPEGTVLTVKSLTFSKDQVTWSLPSEFSEALRPHLVASPYLELDDPEIQRLSKLALGQERNPFVAANLIEAFVQSFITRKDLSVGFASAAQTARSRAGDCTEHAVLAAALARAGGLPARLVIGLGYLPPGTPGTPPEAVNGVFGFHMWAEAYLNNNQWKAMDSALGGFDVGHIALLKTDLSPETDSSELYLPILQLMGRLKISVVLME